MNGVGVCSCGRGRLGCAAGFGVMWFWLGYRVLVEYVLLDQADMFSGPVVPFAMGLGVVALQGGSLIDYSAGDVCGLVLWG